MWFDLKKSNLVVILDRLAKINFYATEYFCYTKQTNALKQGLMLAHGSKRIRKLQSNSRREPQS